MNVKQRTLFAMENYMINHPKEWSEFGVRGSFDVWFLPDPFESVPHQWCDGDLTSRAMDAWMYARMITGDMETGKDIEKAQENYFFNLFHPENGLVYVREHSVPNRDGYFYHLWDEGRALKHLVNRYHYMANTPEEKSRIRGMIDALIEGCKSFSTTVTEENGQISRYWEADAFWNNRPVKPEEKFGNANILNFTMGCGQLLDPVAKMYVTTKDPSYKELVLELTSAFLQGYEHRRGSTSPMFGPKGEFIGHFHSVASALCGLVILARGLYEEGEETLAREYIDLAIRSYKWIFSEENQNRGSSMGWFPECTAPAPIVTDVNEFCCTADMIEWAVEMAKTAEVVPGYEWMDDLWDDVDRFTINEGYAMQIVGPEAYRNYMVDPSEEKQKAYDDLILTGKGGWAASVNWPFDMMRILEEKVTAFSIGCCLYSGQRGFYGYWSSIVSKTAEGVIVRFAGDYEGDGIRTTQRPEGGFALTMAEAAKVKVRIPKTAKKETLVILANGTPVPVETMANGYVTFEGLANITYEVAWEDLAWEVKESVGAMVDENGKIVNENGRKIVSTIHYKGNKVVGFDVDREVLVPFTKGL